MVLDSSHNLAAVPAGNHSHVATPDGSPGHNPARDSHKLAPVVMLHDQVLRDDRLLRLYCPWKERPHASFVEDKPVLLVWLPVAQPIREAERMMVACRG